jgi:hypothetical protein
MRLLNLIDDRALNSCLPAATDPISEKPDYSWLLSKSGVSRRFEFPAAVRLTTRRWPTESGRRTTPKTASPLRPSPCRQAERALGSETPESQL